MAQYLRYGLDKSTILRSARNDPEKYRRGIAMTEAMIEKTIKVIILKLKYV
jgi:hypothetical protein